MADYGKAIELNLTYSLAYRNRGSAYLLRGELELAIADLDRSIELDPGNSTAYISRGVVRAASGNLTLAVGDYTLAIMAQPMTGWAAMQKPSSTSETPCICRLILPLYVPTAGPASTPKTT